MIYNRCSPRERQVIDELVAFGNDRSMSSLGKRLGMAPATVKTHVRKAGLRYGIDTSRFSLSVRLVYLRAQEMGLIQ